MSSLVLRRIRGAAGTMLTWAVGWGIIGLVTGAGVSLAALVPRGYFSPIGSVIVGFGIAGAIAGAMSGLGFATLLAASARRGGARALKASRFALLGAAPAALTGYLLSHQAGFTVACGAMGLAAATASFAVARKALAAGDGELGSLPSGI